MRAVTLSWVLERVHIGDAGCWEWLRARDPASYGRTSKKAYGEQWAHRLVYRSLVGPIPEGLQIDHLCRNRCCVNPAHLEPVTQSENSRRSPIIGRAQSAKPLCVNGHPRLAENLYRAPSGRTACRICKRDALRRLRAKGVA